MKILIIGDIFGKAGKEIIKQHLKDYKKKFNPDVIIANGENVSEGGKSLVKMDYDFLKNCGIDYFTMGNHTFHNREINTYINNINDMVRPANYKNKVKGQGFLIFNWKGKKILLLNLLGMGFMNIPVNNPFIIADQILENNQYDISILDFHTETTSEKKVLSNYLKDKVTIFYGTHTHIQTSDLYILNKKMVYITDIGMTGIRDSAIGVEYKEVTNLLKNGIKDQFKEATEGPKIFNAIFIEINDSTNLPVKIKRISNIF
ncbi:/ / YmdB-like protein / 104600:105379 Forward [Candidatus Hepatoplasma crinochetorum]|uniref:/ / YmdB-like protein / 104600:105379 Forward n=1 Tax=Candidatus Hepatoplasma crinochetorum TaxID=295596 RepID=A0A0G7ZND6_9MOLU|nr:/ / YmdB-like protein / 104600:105379 Forward [Candidatus Hepatoplasma crinochetorum]